MQQTFAAFAKKYLRLRKKNRNTTNPRKFGWISFSFSRLQYISRKFSLSAMHVPASFFATCTWWKTNEMKIWCWIFLKIAFSAKSLVQKAALVCVCWIENRPKFAHQNVSLSGFALMNGTRFRNLLLCFGFSIDLQLNEH